MNSKKRTIIIGIIVALCCIVMSIVDGIIQPDYAIKSIIKLALFLIVPVTYSVFDKNLNIKSLFIPNKIGIITAVSLCIPVYIVIIGAYMLLKDVFDLSQITTSLTSNIGVNRDNFVFVALYISFINSLLEEFFFRGFAFLTLRRVASEKLAYIFSSLLFALYHIAMMIGWFGGGVLILSLVGLFMGGLIFNYLNAKSNNIYTSWFVHMFANFAINTIGFMLFGII
ncbi:MAG: CPBP family intramembrane metalloprotease [Eubacteriales bacterium]|nr:CPBP family intramembrane metalloprotease [Eubacteriales bacterium]